MREVTELLDVEEPAWPIVEEMVAASSGRARILAVERAAGELCLYRLQVTVRSVLGALALQSGGVVLDDRWMLLLGGGHPPLVDLATANGLVGDRTEPAAMLEVGRDILGGIFAVNGGGLPGAVGNVHYFTPDSLEWKDLGIGHAAFVSWAITGDIDTFYSHLRWPGWREQVRSIPLDHALSVFPSLFTAEGKNLQADSRRPVPWDELWRFHEEMRRQLAELPSGKRVRFRIRRGT